MITPKGFILTFLAACFSLAQAQSQSVISAAGSNSSGSAGSVSFSAGQLFYTMKQGQPGTVSEGVQQPYEISVITELEEVSNNNLMIVVYPNPADHLLMLRMNETDLIKITWRLYNLEGSLVETREVHGRETSIGMEKRAPGIYFLKIIADGKEIKTFKIIKK